MSFGGGSKPAPAAPAPPPPIIDDTALKAQQDMDALRRRQGRASTILSGKQGGMAPQTATQQLLGG